MKPPICELCGNRFSPDGGGLVTFVGDERSIEWHRRARVEGIVGHPPDQGWLCGEHVEAARQLSDEMPLPAVLAALRLPSIDRPDGSQPDSADQSSTQPAHTRQAAQADDRGDDTEPIAPTVDAVPSLASDAEDPTSVSQVRQHIDSRRDFPIFPSSITLVGRLVDDAFETMLSVLVSLDPSLDGLPPMSFSSDVEVLESPEWRERGPAADEVTETRTVDAAGWILQRRHRHLDWRYGGQGRASESISISPLRRESTFDRWMLFMASMPIGDRVTEVSVSGDVPDFLQPVIDRLIADLEASDGTEA